MRTYSILLIATGALLAFVGVRASVPAGTTASPLTQSVAQGELVFKDIRVFDGTTLLPRTSVLVRGGTIAALGPDLPAPSGAEIIEGAGKTLLPGLIDAHTHAFGDALERALIFGVTTELDMFTDHRFAARQRAEQRAPGGASRRADLYSAGTLVTAPKGHGTEYGLPIPTITRADEAEAFVDARVAEGSDYIKIVYDDARSHGTQVPTITADILRAVIVAARKRDTLAVVHIGSGDAAEEAIAAGASGLVHLFGDAPPMAGFAARVKESGAFVIPTLSVIESTTGAASGATLAKDSRVSPFLSASERTSLNRSFPVRAGSSRTLAHALEAVRSLHGAGVPLLAGSDAPNPGTAHGATVHRELELLVTAGLPPAAALSAATALPARAFKLEDRGRIAPGLRADLVLVAGDPLADITATRDILGIWKGGARLERRNATEESSAPVAGGATGIISTFDGAAPAAEFGAGWMVSTDSMMGGASTATIALVRGGANASHGALEVSGTIAAGSPYPWAGAMFHPGATPMAPANLSRFKEIVFWTKGDGRGYQLLLFATSLGNVPAARRFAAGPEWQQVVVPIASFDVSGSDIRGLLFSATQEGAFRFAIDDVRLR